MHVYVASSWRNARFDRVVATLVGAGINAYNFRKPVGDDSGFSWTSIDPNWQHWSSEQYMKALRSPQAVRGYNRDLFALTTASACLLVLPCGRSAHLELGWCAGRNIPTGILLDDESEPELMYKMVDYLFTDVGEVVNWLAPLSYYMPR